MLALETIELNKIYGRGKVHALRDFSLQVESGKIFSLLGPNGAGKTTLIKVLLGIIHPDHGSAQILSVPFTDISIHHRIGYLAENHRFPEFLSAAQILYYYGRMTGISSGVLKKRIPELLTQMKLADWMHTRIRKYSKGMMQRMGLAHAMLNDPDILFLDEPTDGIDPVGRREIRDIMKGLRNRGKTIFVNSHLLSEVERISDEVAIMRDGALIRQGTLEDFTTVRQQYQLKLSEHTPSVHTVFDKLGISFENQDQLYNVTVRDIDELNVLIDRMREHRIIIEGIIPRKISLEDFFIEVIDRKEAPSL